MNKWKRRVLLVAGLSLLIICHHYVMAQGDETVLDKRGVVRSSERMLYPPIARQARIEGVVVVRVRLDNTGEVVSATAVSGAKLLIADSLSNAKTWRFSSNAGNVAIIIYEFRIMKGKCNVAKGHFVFREPNIAVVTGCADEWQP
jgi:TonB family protein